MKPKNIYIFFLTIILLVLIIQSKILKIKTEEEIIPKTEIEKPTITISVMNNNETKVLDLEDYIIGVVSCEMPALFEEEALKAGAIAARTYAIEKINNNPNYIFKGTTSDQCFNNEEELKEKWQNEYEEYYNKIQNQVKSTMGKYITYEGKPIKAYYFSVSNGYTESVQNVFKEELDYLVSKESPQDKNTTAFERTITIPKQEFIEKLNIENTSDIKIENITKTESERVKTITINNTIFSGIDIRKLLNLRSTDFTIEIENDTIKITTKGYGHGVGMSQYGANELAKTGYNYEEIIKYYYQNVQIEEL